MIKIENSFKAEIPPLCLNTLPKENLAQIISFLPPIESLTPNSPIFKISKFFKNLLTHQELNIKKLLPTTVDLSPYDLDINNYHLHHLIGRPITHLNVSFSSITDAGLARLVKTPLQSLNISGCELITNKGLTHLASMPLRKLNLATCERISDAGLTHLAHKSLQELHLANCQRITDGGLAHLTKMPLQTLNLHDCQRITDGGLAHLAHLPLQNLDLTICYLITNAGLAHLKSMRLQSLNLAYCRFITDVGLAHTKSKLPQTFILSGILKKSRPSNYYR